MTNHEAPKQIIITELGINEREVRWRLSVIDRATTLESGAYRTNQCGCGLWRNDCQVLGTFQFALRADHEQAAAAIRQYFQTKWESGLSQRLPKQPFRETP